MDNKTYKSLRPALLTNEDGIDVAPLTIAKQVFSDMDLDGNLTQEDVNKNVKDVETILEELKNTSNVVLSTKVQVVEATFDGQCIFNIEYPIENYDIEQFPITVFARRTKGGIPEYIPADNYIINQNYPNDDQILFNTNKVEEFNKGESFAIIYHYANTIYRGSTVNADLIYNIYVSLGRPGECQEVLKNSVYLDFDNSQIIYYDADGKPQYFPIGTDKLIQHRITIESNAPEIKLNFEDYNPLEDTLVVYENNTYVPMGEYYVIDENMVMRKTNNIIWVASSYSPINFDFLIYKRSSGIQVSTEIYNPSTSGSGSGDVPNYSITKDKLSVDLQQTIDELQTRIATLESLINNK